MDNSVSKYLTSREFAKYTGLPYRIVLELIKTGKLRGFRKGNKTFYVLVESFYDLATSTFDPLCEMTPEKRAETEERLSKIHKEG